MNMKIVGLMLCLAGLGACAEDADPRPVKWSFIHAAIIVPNCATSGCHSTLSHAYTFDLEDKASAYETFKFSIGTHGNGGDLGFDIGELIDGQSELFYRMPPDQPLPQTDIDLIKAWLAGDRKDE
jgi:hypothetical protein